MQLTDAQFVNLNVLCHEGGYHSIDSGKIWKLPEHRFAQNKFYYILEGGCTIRIDGVDYEGIPGRWFYIPEGSLHAYSNDTTRHFCKHWMHFDLTPHDPDLFSAAQLPPYVDIAPGGEVDRLFEAYSKIKNSNMLEDKLQVRSLLTALLSAYIRLAVPNSVRIISDAEASAEELLTYIKSNLTQDLSNTALASLMNMSVRSFIRYFKTVTGYTPAKYVTFTRMSVAKNLLEETELSIPQIMDRVGIDDLSLFSKLFKKHYSHSPRAYRKHLRQAV